MMWFSASMSCSISFMERRTPGAMRSSLTYSCASLSPSCAFCARKTYSLAAILSITSLTRICLFAIQILYASQVIRVRNFCRMVIFIFSTGIPERIHFSTLSRYMRDRLLIFYKY